MSNNNTLKKSVTTIEAMAIVVGMIIGSGVFLKPGVVLSNAGTPIMSIMAWIAGGIITLAAALSVAEVSAAIPKEGGLYNYLEELYCEPVGFLLGWVQSIITYPASIAAEAIGFAVYASFFVAMDLQQQRFLAVGAMAFLLLMNIIATKCGGVIQTVATIGKLLPLAAIIFFGVFSGVAPEFTRVTGSTSEVGFGVAVLGTLWAYEGWISVTNMAGELQNPSKTLPRSISIGVLFVVVIYVLFNIAIFQVLPYEYIIESSIPAADAAEVLFGSTGAALLSAGIMISVFGALNGYLMTGARVPHAMAIQKLLPFSRLLGKVNIEFRTPSNALIFQSVLAVIYIFTGTFNTLTDLLVFVLWIFFTLGVFSVFILRKRFPQREGLYRVPLYPVTPLIGIAGGVYILTSTVIADPVRSLIGIGLTLIGLPVYYYLKKKH